MSIFLANSGNKMGQMQNLQAIQNEGKRGGGN